MLGADKTITVYNRYFDPLQDCDGYQRTVIVGASWNKQQLRRASDNGLISADTTTVRIPQAADAGARNYIACTRWAELTAEQRAAYWTLNEGDKIVLGEAPQEIGPEFPYSALDKRYELLVVKGWADNRGRPNPHWKVVG